MKKIKIFVSLFLIIGVSYCLVYGYGTKISWKDDTDARIALEQEDLKMVSIDIMASESFLLPEEVNTFKKLYESADVVVRVRMTVEGKRTKYTQCTLSEVEVIDALKGKTEANSIFVFEPIYTESGMSRAEGAYCYLEDNADYVLFLRKIKCSLYEKQSYVYLPTTTAFSKYKIRNNHVIGKAYLREQDNGIPYDAISVVGYDISTNKKEIVKQYEENSKSVESLIRGEKLVKK